MRRDTESRRIAKCAGWFLFWFTSADAAAFADRLLLGKRYPIPAEAVLVWHLLICGAAVIYLRFYRPNKTHPAMNPAYLEWLKSTPWNPSLRLPLGPGTLAPIDYAMLTALVGIELALKPGLPYLTVICAGAISFFSTLAVLSRTRTRPEVHILLLLGSLLLWLVPRFLPMFAVSIAILIVSHVGLRRALNTYPWERPVKPRVSLQPQIYENLDPEIEFGRGLVLSILWASWLGAIVHTLRWPFELTAVVYSVFALLAALIRLTAYTSNTVASADLRYRIRSWRWVIWSYDKVYITPILGLIAAAVVVLLCKRVQDSGLLAGMGVLTTLCINILGGPRLKFWRLTGLHSVKLTKASLAGAQA